MTIIDIYYRYWQASWRKDNEGDINSDGIRVDVRVSKWGFEWLVSYYFCHYIWVNEIAFKDVSHLFLSFFPGTKNLSQRVQHLMNEILLKTLLLSADAASKVDEIHIQLSVLQRQCNYRDRPLCDTLNIKSFEEMGFIERLKVVSRLRFKFNLTAQKVSIFL